MRRSYIGKYSELYEFLRGEAEPVQVLTFGKIENILGFELPESARKHQAWWANQDRGQCLAWIRAGYRTAALSIDEERLTFIREDYLDESHDVQSPSKRDKAGLTIAEAKERLAHAFGVDPDQIEITIRA